MRCLATGEGSPLSARENLGTVALVEATARSVDTGEEVALQQLGNEVGVAFETEESR
jgi:hypothetical protein